MCAYAWVRDWGCSLSVECRCVRVCSLTRVRMCICKVYMSVRVWECSLTVCMCKGVHRSLCVSVSAV